jgi:hypothetical protein
MWQYLVILDRFDRNLNFLKRLSQIAQISNLMKMYHKGWMDRWKEMMNLRVIFCNFTNAPKSCQVSLPDPVVETAPGPLYMCLFVNSDELFGLHERLEIYWLAEKLVPYSQVTLQLLWDEDFELLRHNKALCKVSQLLYCKTQIFARCSHTTSSSIVPPSHHLLSQ